MAALTYAGFSVLANTDWSLSGGEFDSVALTVTRKETISFGAETDFIKYKTYTCTVVSNGCTTSGKLTVWDTGGVATNITLELANAVQRIDSVEHSVGALAILKGLYKGDYVAI